MAKDSHCALTVIFTHLSHLYCVDSHCMCNDAFIDFFLYQGYEKIEWLQQMHSSFM